MDIQRLFALAMKRDVPQLLDFPAGEVLNLGAGASKIPGAVNLDFPEWDAESYHIDRPDESVAGVHAYHFLEHVRDPRRMLREIQRVLVPGGVVNICVPHYGCSMAHHDLDHKNTYALDTWANAFGTPYYSKDREGWRFRVHFNVLMAITERNTAILTQLVKE